MNHPTLSAEATLAHWQAEADAVRRRLAAPGVARPEQVAGLTALSKIARHYYGNANAWPKIFDANKDKIKNPDLIHPGQVLKIPA